MKIDALIEKLEVIKKEHGNLDVYIPVSFNTVQPVKTWYDEKCPDESLKIKTKL